ncbi:putative COG4 transport protein [Elsinoe fawcettii]|nr:putative COG4 transport protein [Elsinoe fawcettii]
MTPNGTINGVKLPTKSIHNATTASEIQAALDALGRQEKSVTSKLDELVASQKDLARQLARLDIARAQLGPQVTAVRSISNGMLSSASSTAARISGAVKRLDNEQAAVKATLQVVEQVAELKACVLGVHGAMEGTQDWELAATYLNRASKVPKEVIDGSFAEEIVPTAEVPDPPRTTLDNAAENLCVLFLREFEKATKEGDGTNVTRFFKLFPLIGRQEVGLDAYGRYVCGGVSSRARNNLSSGQKKEGLFYALNMTKLFEHIAQIVDGHEPIVTRHYGPGMMKKVIERLQVEADVQGGLILDTWSEEGQVTRKLTDVKSYAFTFLVQSFLPTQKNQPSFRPSSPAVHDRNGSRASEDDGGVDMKAVDGLLNEMAMMLGRWALYSKFLATKLQVSDDAEQEKGLIQPSLIANSSLQRKATDMLIEPFNAMTTFFFRRSVEKAFQMDEAPADLTLNPNKALGSGPPFITSAVDDVMYILNQVLQRSLGTSQRAVVASVIPSISRVLGSDFYGMIQRKMRDESYPKAAIQGALPPENLIISFLVLMNNLDVSTDYVQRIVGGQVAASDDDDQSERPRMSDYFPFGNDANFATTQVRNILTVFEAKTSELLAEAVEVLLRQVLRPRLRPVLIETFREVDYAPEEDEPEDDEETEAVSKRFERGWTAFTQPIKRITTDHNFELIQSATVQHLAKMLEKRVWSQYGRVNPLGAIKMERDMTEIINVAVRGGKYGLRDHFTRMQQTLLILNMDDEEWDELMATKDDAPQGENDIDWKLDAAERQRARNILKDRA